MEVWTWIVAYIVGFSLLQLLVYRYFRDSEPSVDGASTGSGEQYSAATDGLERDQTSRRTRDDDGTVCQHCGTFNEHEATYRYCKHCVSPLR
ncbi:DUF7577 domain-containing protein [Halorientalis pallida]|uniref:Zinc ribbon domain-containing protein n=1 Tax=Halorientalis pallida TaxID=2479928 RepID=A0A498L609_9EURY|nr:zinc ribbon domain-containing protein [Halorientalis pallida]RXK50115.1 zinc ribbon domain-containing protein [Halorientalis pallida]